MNFESRLLELVSQNQLLFDTKHLDYDKRPKRKEVWDRIATLLNSDRESCKKRWISLRATYRKLLYKINAEGGRETYNKKWRYFDEIAFINSFECMSPLISQTWDENSMHSTTKNLDDSYKSSPHSFENRLLDAVRCHEVLYNSNYPGYSDVDVRNCAWHLIAKDLNVDKNAVKMKWHTLRSAYNKILRKIVAMGGMASYKRKWIYFDKMSFLNPFIPHLLPKDLAEQYSHSKSTTSEDVEQSYKEEPIDMYDFKTPDHYDDEEYADEQEEFDSNRRLSNATDIKQQAKGERVTSLISSTVVDCENNSSDYSRQSKYCDQELLVEMEEDKNEAMHLDLDDSSNTIESPTSTKKRRIDGKRKIIEIETVSKSAGPCNSYFSLLGSKIDETPVPPSERYKLEKRVTDLVYEVLAKYSLETVDD